MFKKFLANKPHLNLVCIINSTVTIVIITVIVINATE